MVKNPPANAGDLIDVGSIPGSGRYMRGGHGNPLQYSSLENPMRRGAWQLHSPEGHKKSDTTEVISVYVCARACTHTHTHTHIFFSIMVYHRMLNMLPCAIH